MTTMGDDSIFIDTNIFVYAAIENAPMHSVAKATLNTCQTGQTACWINRQVLREFMCIMTRPQTFLPSPEIATVVKQIYYMEARFRVVEDNHQTTHTLLELLEKFSIGGKRVHDVNIVATMLVQGIPRILTHNTRDFEVFSDLITIVPLAE
jgi:predicted nucleic acid-binding protein